jgi:hypothetical protein
MIVMSEEQNVNEQDHTGGNGVDQNQPHVLHAGGEDQQQHGQDGQPHVLRAGGDGQQAQGGKGQAEEAAKQVVRAGAKATVGSAARLAQNGRQAPLQAIDVKALSQSLESVVQSGLVLTRGGQQAWTQWVDYSGHATDRNVRAFNELARIRSIGGLISWQTEVMKANLEDWLHSNLQVYELSAQAAKEAMDKIRESGVQAARATQQRGQA